MSNSMGFNFKGKLAEFKTFDEDSHFQSSLVGGNLGIKLDAGDVAPINVDLSGYLYKFQRKEKNL